MSDQPRPRILIVDDEHHNLHVLGSALKQTYQVLVASSGEQVLKKLAAPPYPDMILLDIIMPGINGFEVCQKLKARPETADIPVIFITARHSEEDEAHGFGLGAVDFISKPIRPSIVRARVLTHLTLQAKKREAEAANKAKSTFLATMSHEIRTPLNGILGMAELLLDIDMDATGREYTQTILTSGRALLNIINDVLDYSKIEADKLQLEAISFSLYQLLNDATILFKEFARKKAIEFNTNIDDILPDWIVGDPTRLRQVLVNLLSNAIKFTQQGRVTLTALPRLHPEHGLLIHLEVRDTGVGISPEHLSRLFQSFEQADSSTTRKHGGTGLGLAISQKLVQLMKGHIEVESTLNAGTLFRVILPIQQSLAPQDMLLTTGTPESLTTGIPESLTHLTHWAGRAKILVAEDDPINQAVLRGMLKRFDFQIDYADNGRQAVELLRHKTYDLIFMDCQMPEMDGYTACRAFRNLEKGQHTPVVALTAFAMEGDREKCLAAGMDDYLTKPVTRQGIQSAILRWLARDASPAPARTKLPTRTPLILDRAAFLVLRADMGEDFDILVAHFLQTLPEKIQTIRQAWTDANPDLLKNAAHALRGSSSQLGSSSLAQCAFEIEKSARNADMTRIGNLIVTLEEEAARLADALLAEQRLASFHQDLGDDHFQNFLRMAQQSLAGLLERILTESSQDSPSLLQIRERALELAGISGSYGLADVERCATALGNRAGNADTPSLSTLLEDLQKSVQKAVSFLEEHARM
ncbi:MAG: response regulator [Magnetococcus sp. DMHC-1]|nr:response regulator [Magnetococcales bacterium]